MLKKALPYCTCSYNEILRRGGGGGGVVENTYSTGQVYLKSVKQTQSRCLLLKLLISEASRI